MILGLTYIETSKHALAGIMYVCNTYLYVEIALIYVRIRSCMRCHTNNDKLIYMYVYIAVCGVIPTMTNLYICTYT